MDPISFEEARRIVLDNLPGTRTEQVDILDALGKVLASDVVARREQPTEPHSLRDGYAVQVCELAPATQDSPVALRLAGQIAAGDVPSTEIESGSCIGISTGAPLPLNADGVIPAEEASVKGESILFFTPATSKQYV
ncbi:MAG: gephyrin-like molybdotransferase Glp, partial [Planctomycetota bacterium]